MSKLIPLVVTLLSNIPRHRYTATCVRSVFVRELTVLSQASPDITDGS